MSEPPKSTAIAATFKKLQDRGVDVSYEADENLLRFSAPAPELAGCEFFVRFSRHSELVQLALTTPFQHLTFDAQSSAQVAWELMRMNRISAIAGWLFDEESGSIDFRSHFFTSAEQELDIATFLRVIEACQREVVAQLSRINRIVSGQPAECAPEIDEPPFRVD